MDTKFDLMSIYGIPPAKYNEDDPNDLFLEGLPSLEQIASFNLAATSQHSGMQQISPQGNINVMDTSTPSTVIGNATGAIMPATMENNISASGELPEGTDLQQLITDYSKPYPVTAESIQYLNGFIRTQIGRRAQIQFLMGNAELIEKDGFLLGVGANYILINEIGTNDITACDFYNIKFIRFLY